MERKYIQPIKLIFYHRLCLFVLVWSIYFIVFVIGVNNEYTEDILALPQVLVSCFSDAKNTMMTLLFILCEMFIQNFCFFIIYQDSFIFLAILQSIKVFEMIYCFIINTPQASYFIASIVGAIILIIGLLIFAELLVLNFCEMNMFTKKIVSRSLNEVLISIEFLKEQRFDNKDENEKSIIMNNLNNT